MLSRAQNIFHHMINISYTRACAGPFLVYFIFSLLVQKFRFNNPTTQTPWVETAPTGFKRFHKPIMGRLK